MIGVLFDGLAYGALLFLVSVGLSVTMGLMNFVNLAHGAFAMAGGYVCAVAMARWSARSVRPARSSSVETNSAPATSADSSTSAMIAAGSAKPPRSACAMRVELIGFSRAR